MDIVEKLRSGVPFDESWTELAARTNGERSEAADLIESLREQLKATQDELSRYTRYAQSKSISELTERIVSDCGISSEHRPLVEKIERRLWEYFDEQLATTKLEGFNEGIEEAAVMVREKFNLGGIAHSIRALKREVK